MAAEMVGVGFLWGRAAQCWNVPSIADVGAEGKSEAVERSRVLPAIFHFIGLMWQVLQRVRG